MKSFRFLLAALLFAAPLCAFPPDDSQQNSQEQAQAIRINVDRVNVGVIVTDASGHLQAAYALLNGLSTGDRVAVVKYVVFLKILLHLTSNILPYAALIVGR